MDDVLCHYDPKITLRDAHTFEPKTEFVELAKAAKKDGCDIVIATARKSFHQWKTWRWLEAQGLEVNAAYHRKGDTTQTSSEAKRDMLTDIMKTWEIITFFDDSADSLPRLNSIGSGDLAGKT